jgi:hypothetical protein
LIPLANPTSSKQVWSCTENRENFRCLF